MVTEYSHNPPYKGTAGGAYNISVLPDIPCDCNALNQVSFIPNGNNTVWNDNACFRTRLSLAFVSQPVNLPDVYWSGPGTYNMDLMFVTKQKFYGLDIGDFYNWYSDINPFLDITCFVDVKATDLSGPEDSISNDRAGFNEFGIDFLLQEVEVEDPLVLRYNLNSESLTGHGSSVSSWDGTTDNGPAIFNQSSLINQPDNLQQFIRYDQGKIIKSAVDFDLNDYLYTSNVDNALDQDDELFSISGQMAIFIVAEPISGNPNNNLISFHADSPTSGSGFSLQCISGTDHAGQLNLSGSSNHSYDFSYDNVEPGPSMYALSFANDFNYFQFSINGKKIHQDSIDSPPLPPQGYYQFGSGFSGKIYQAFAVKSFGDQSNYRVEGSLAQKWGIANKLPIEHPYYEPKKYAFQLANQHLINITGNKSAYISGELATFTLFPKRGLHNIDLSGEGLLVGPTAQKTVTVENISYNCIERNFSIIITGDTVLNFSYENLPQYNLNISGSGVNEGAGAYFSGEQISISTSFSGDNVKFVEWESGSVADIYNQNTNITLTEDTTLNAKYRLKHYYNLFLEGEGLQSGSGLFLEDEVVSITGYAPNFHQFSEWEVTSGSHSIKNYSETTRQVGYTLTRGYDENLNPTKFIITGDIEITANYIPKQYVINAAAAYDNGLISGVENNTFFDLSTRTYTGNQQVQLTGIANSGYGFSHWETGDNNYYSGDILNFTVTDNNDVLGFFVPEFQFAYQNYTGLFSGGAVNASAQGMKQLSEQVSYSVIADPGFEFDSIIFENPIYPASKYTGQSSADDINFLQTSVAFNNKSQLIAETVDSFNLPLGSNNNPGLFMPSDLNDGSFATVGPYSEFNDLLTYFFNYNVPLFQSSMSMSELSNGSSTMTYSRILGISRRRQKVDFQNSSYSINNTYTGETNIIEYVHYNDSGIALISANGDSRTDAPETLYPAGTETFEYLLDTREQVNTNWCGIKGSSLNPDNKILTFKSSFVAYKGAGFITPKIRLELFPCNLSSSTVTDFDGYNREKEESYGIYSAEYYQSSIENKSFRGAYFDLENSRLHIGRQAPNGFHYTYQMVKVFENSEYTEYDVSVSVVAQAEHADVYTLIIQSFATSPSTNRLPGQYLPEGQVHFKFGVKNLFLGQRSSRQIYNFDKSISSRALDFSLSYDFNAAFLFRKINSDSFEDQMRDLPFAPELSRNDLLNQGPRLFIFGKHQTEAPFPNHFDKNKEYKLGLNPPVGHRFSRYRALGKGIRSDVGFFELDDQDIDLSSLFQRQSRKISVDVKDETYRIGTPEFYERFGSQWRSAIEEVPSSDYMGPSLISANLGYANLKSGADRFDFGSTSVTSYEFFTKAEDARYRHYYFFKSYEPNPTEAEFERYMKKIYANHPIIQRYSIDPVDSALRMYGHNYGSNDIGFNTVRSVNWTPYRYYRFKTRGDFLNFQNHFVREFECRLSDLPAFTGGRTINPNQHYDQIFTGLKRWHGQVSKLNDNFVLHGRSREKFYHDANHNYISQAEAERIAIRNGKPLPLSPSSIYFPHGGSLPYAMRGPRGTLENQEPWFIIPPPGTMQLIPIIEGMLGETAIAVSKKKFQNNVFYYQPNESISYFDCKLMQSNIKENSLLYIAQCKKFNNRSVPSIEWTSTDGQDISDATFRFRPDTVNLKHVFKIYRVLLNNSEKYVGQMTCLDVHKGEFIINWDGDLSNANITANNFDRSSYNFSVSQAFSASQTNFKNNLSNSFYAINDQFAIDAIPDFEAKITNFSKHLGNQYSVNNRSVVTKLNGSRPIVYPTVLLHPLLGKGWRDTIFTDDKRIAFINGFIQAALLSNAVRKNYFADYILRLTYQSKQELIQDQFKVLMYAFISIQEFFQDYFFRAPINTSKTRNYWKVTVAGDQRRDYYFPYASGSTLTAWNNMRERYIKALQNHRTASLTPKYSGVYLYELMLGDEIYGGININYTKPEENMFSYDRNNGIRTPNQNFSIISTNVSQVSDVFTEHGDIISSISANPMQVVILNQIETNVYHLRDYDHLSIDTIEALNKPRSALLKNAYVASLELHSSVAQSPQLKNNFIFTNPEITHQKEHYITLNNIALSSMMLDISQEYNKLSRAHWVEATPGSVLADANNNFTNVTFDNDDIHLEIIYDE